MPLLRRTFGAFCLLATIDTAIGCSVIGCSNARSLQWGIEFDDGLADRAAIVVGRIRAGGCDGDVLFEDDVAPGEMASMPTSLEPGTYAFEGVARDASCVEYAGGCVTLELPADEGNVVVTLSAGATRAACPAGMCDEGRCMTADAGPPPDGGGADVGGDAGRDGGTDAPMRLLPVGDAVRIDFGTATSAGWSNHTEFASTSGPLTSMGGVTLDLMVSTSGFNGVQLGGSMTNTLGYPGTASSDSFWVGSFDGHAAALPLTGRVEVTGFMGGEYEIELFASRDGDDAGIGRLTRYRIGTETFDLDASDNTSETITFDRVRPNASGVIRLEVTVSPDGMGRFAYIGTLVLRRL
jgi:hypothetical protein